MPKDDFDAKNAIKEVEDANEGINFDNKVKETIRRSNDVHKEIKGIVWVLLKEKIVWVVLGAFSFVILGLFKEVISKLISKI